MASVTSSIIHPLSIHSSIYSTMILLSRRHLVNIVLTGDDDGKVFGALIKGEVNKGGKKKRQHKDSYDKKIKKRKKLNNAKQTRDKCDNEDESDDDKSEGDSDDDKSGDIQSSLIQLVADYDSDNEEEEPKKLEIPRAIQGTHPSTHTHNEE